MTQTARAGRVTALAQPTWTSLRELGMDAWAWLDMASTPDPVGEVRERGFHLGQLPAQQPAQITHAWGWSATRLVRARFDRHVPGGIAGALLELDSTGAASTVVRHQRAEIWPAGEGRTSMLRPPSVPEDAALDLFGVSVNSQILQFVSVDLREPTRRGD